MKRFLTFLGVTMIFVAALACTAFAADTSVVIKSAQADAEKSYVMVDGSISGVSKDQQLTYLLTEVKDGTYDENSIYYINQNAYTSNDGSFSLKLGVKGTLEAGRAYILRIGGTGVDKPAEFILTTSGNGEVEFIYGDANSDGLVNFDDAKVVLQYVLNPSAVDTKLTSAADFVKKINVTGEEEITAKQASNIVQKALNSSFKFPVENSVKTMSIEEAAEE